MRLGLRDANQRFSSFVKTIKRGEEIILTDRGQPIAVVTPIRGDTATGVIIDRLARAGLVRLPVRVGPVGPANPVPARGKPLSRFLAEERASR